MKRDVTQVFSTFILFASQNESVLGASSQTCGHASS